VKDKIIKEINSTDHHLSLEATRHAVVKEIHVRLWHPRVHYQFHKEQSIVT